MNDLENLLMNIKNDPSRYIIIDREREYTVANFSKTFNIPMSTINNWMIRNRILVRNISELNDLKLMQLDIPTLQRMKQYDVLARIDREDKLSLFLRTIKVINNMKWVSDAISLIDSEANKEERYNMIERLQNLIMMSSKGHNINSTE
jgi:hypothetical protein